MQRRGRSTEPRGRRRNVTITTGARPGMDINLSPCVLCGGKIKKIKKKYTAAGVWLQIREREHTLNGDEGEDELVTEDDDRRLNIQL